MDAVSSAAIDTSRAAPAKPRAGAQSADASSFAALLAPFAQPSSTSMQGDGAAPENGGGGTDDAAQTQGGTPAATTASDADADACTTQSGDSFSAMATMLAVQTQTTPEAAPVAGVAQASAAVAAGDVEVPGFRLGQVKAPGEPAPPAATAALTATPKPTGANEGASAEAQAAATAGSAASPTVSKETGIGGAAASLDPARLADLARGAAQAGAGPDTTAKASPAQGVGATTSRPAKDGARGAGKTDAATPDAPLRQLRAGGDDTQQIAAALPTTATGGDATPFGAHKDGAFTSTGAQTAGATPPSAQGAQPAPTPALAGGLSDAAAGDVAGLGGATSGAGGAAPSSSTGGAPATATPTTLAHFDRAAAATGQLASQIARRFDGRTTSFDVRLDPAELGRVDVRIEVGADRKVKATVAAESASTLADLVGATRELEQALKDAGLDLSDAGLTFNLAGDGGAGFANTRGDAQGADAPARAMARDIADAGAEAEPPRRAAAPLSLSRWSGARLDVWA